MHKGDCYAQASCNYCCMVQSTQARWGSPPIHPRINEVHLAHVQAKSNSCFSFPLDFRPHVSAHDSTSMHTMNASGLPNLWFRRPFPIKLVVKRPFPPAHPHQFLGSGGMRNNELIWIGNVFLIIHQTHNIIIHTVWCPDSSNGSLSSIVTVHEPSKELLSP